MCIKIICLICDVINAEVTVSFLTDSFSIKSQDKKVNISRTKKVNISRTKRAFNMNKKRFSLLEIV